MKSQTANPALLRELLVQVSGADRRAFSLLHRLTRGKVYAVAMRVLRQPSDAEEVTQDVFLKVWRHAKSYDPSSPHSPISWLSTIARRSAIDLLRSRKPTSMGELSGDFVDGRETPLEVMLSNERCIFASLAIDQLSPEKRSAIIGAYVIGSSYADIALELGLPINTLRTRLRRGLRDLAVLGAKHQLGS